MVIVHIMYKNQWKIEKETNEINITIQKLEIRGQNKTVNSKDEITRT